MYSLDSPCSLPQGISLQLLHLVVNELQRRASQLWRNVTEVRPAPSVPPSGAAKRRDAQPLLMNQSMPAQELPRMQCHDSLS